MRFTSKKNKAIQQTQKKKWPEKKDSTTVAPDHKGEDIATGKLGLEEYI